MNIETTAYQVRNQVVIKVLMATKLSTPQGISCCCIKNNKIQKIIETDSKLVPSCCYVYFYKHFKHY